MSTIQQDQYKANVEKAQSDIDATKAKLDYAETEYKRFGRLYEQKAAAATQVDQWKFERDLARAALEAAQANLVNAKLNLSYTTVTAPFDGRMGRHLIDTGNLVGAGGQETVLAEINRINPMYVYFTINERDLLRVTEPEDGQSAGAAPRQNKQVLYMGLSTKPGYPYQGELDYAGITVNPQTGTLQLRGIFPNPDSRIVPGLFARVQAPYAQTRDAVLVPAEAVAVIAPVLPSRNPVLACGDQPSLVVCSHKCVTLRFDLKLLQPAACSLAQPMEKCSVHF